MNIILPSLTAVLWLPLGKSPSPVVKTPLGDIEGFMSQINGVPVKSFLGIPFAKPPLGSLRFLKPKPVEPWRNTLKATKQPPACMQYSEVPFPAYDNMPGKSEDCLYLNIFTPFFATNESKLAVIFWIYGGAFTFGSNRLDAYDGRVLAETENVIVVTINYRLGLFGFLTSNTSDAPGNVGLYDMVLALQWVNDNIEFFGGDKDRITIAGESAGSIAVSVLCVSPLTKGLFSRAILESATLITQRGNKLDLNLNLSEKIAEAVNCATEGITIYSHPTEVVECLRNRDATYMTKILWSFNPNTGLSFLEQYGDSLLPNNAIDDVKNGNFHNVPILAGSVQNEGSSLLTRAYLKEFGFFGQKDSKVNKMFAKTLLETAFSNTTDKQKYIDYYLEDVSDDDYYQIRSQVATAYGDSVVLCPTVFFAESYAKRKNDVYFFFFTRRPSNTPFAKWMGVVHFEEVQFFFGRPVRVPQNYNKDEVRLSKKIMNLWANFAKYGNPCSSQRWPKYSRENPIYFVLDINNYGTLGTGPHLRNCNFLRNYFN